MLRAASVFLLVSAALLPAAAAAQAPMQQVSPETAGLASAPLDEISALLDEFVEAGHLAGVVVGVARGGNIAYLDAAGVQDLASGSPMTERSIFRIYSMAKAVTAVGAMMLHEEGKFELDDPVSDYMPAFERLQVLDAATGTLRPPSRPVTVRDLFLHTSGLSHRNDDLYADAQVRSRSIPMAQFVDNVVSQPLMEDPGTVYRYSESPTILGGLIEIWSGQPLDVFMEERIFAPLGMTDTGFWVEPGDVSRLATAYRPLESGGLEPFELEAAPFTVKPEILEGAVGLVSTVPDYLRFGQMLLNEGELGGQRLLSPETVRMMVANGLSDSIVADRGNGLGWGLANVNVILDPTTVRYPSATGEYTWNGSAGTIFWVNPAEDMVIVIMQQRQPSDVEGLRQQIKTLVHEAITRWVEIPDGD
jgi:CubicO group peptidase (beta-lactamase class C family)